MSLTEASEYEIEDLLEQRAEYAFERFLEQTNADKFVRSPDYSYLVRPHDRHNDARAVEIIELSSLNGNNSARRNVVKEGEVYEKGSLPPEAVEYFEKLYSKFSS